MLSVKKIDPQKKLAVLGLIIFVFGCAVGGYGYEYWQNRIIKLQKAIAVRAGQQKLINPLLECDQSENNFVETKTFQKQVEEFTEQLENENYVSEASVYFRDLNNGPWFGVEEQASYAPASLLKVPLAMAYYKKAEDDPEILQKTVLFNGPDPSWPPVTQTILPEKNLQAGQAYTMAELIERMLAYSDNQAYYLLFNNIDIQTLLSVYSDFGINLGDSNAKNETTVNVKDYAGFFRILFNASYLDRKDSEKLLELLANSEFNDGLIAGVPSGTTVSHKFSERETVGSDIKYLSDCGIVYYSNHPYLLCVMTKGTDLTRQASAISKISSLVYREVNKQFSENISGN